MKEVKNLSLRRQNNLGDLPDGRDRIVRNYQDDSPSLFPILQDAQSRGNVLGKKIFDGES